MTPPNLPRPVTWAQSGSELRIYRGGQLVAVIAGKHLVGLAQDALNAFAEGARDG